MIIKLGIRGHDPIVSVLSKEVFKFIKITAECRS